MWLWTGRLQFANLSYCQIKKTLFKWPILLFISSTPVDYIIHVHNECLKCVQSFTCTSYSDVVVHCKSPVVTICRWPHSSNTGKIILVIKSRDVQIQDLMKRTAIQYQLTIWIMKLELVKVLGKCDADHMAQMSRYLNCHLWAIVRPYWLNFIKPLQA